MTTLGREIKKARIDKQLKQKEVQVLTGVSQKYLSRIENDKVDPSWSIVQKIARALRLDLNFTWQEDER